jgi:hypothetical protein
VRGLSGDANCPSPGSRRGARHPLPATAGRGHKPSSPLALFPLTPLGPGLCILGSFGRHRCLVRDGGDSQAARAAARHGAGNHALRPAGRTEQSDGHRAHGERRGSGSTCDGLADAHPPRQHQPRDRCSLRDLCARSTRRPVRRPRRLFQRTPCAIGALGDALSPLHVFRSSICRSRRADELRSERDRCAPSDGRLCRSRPQGREACRPAGHASDQVRAGHQSPDREDTGP